MRNIAGEAPASRADRIAPDIAESIMSMALEKRTVGARYHAVADEGVTLREVASVIGRRLNVPVVSKSAEEAGKHFGWFAHFAAMDNPASSQRTRELLGWEPTQPGLIADLDRPNYFAETGFAASLR